MKCMELHCTKPGVGVRLRCPAGRPDAVAAYCHEHGGPLRARRVAEADWLYAAPASVGDERAVQVAGRECLRTVHAYVVLRQEPEANGAVWLAWHGIGSTMAAVANPFATPRLHASGEPKLRRNGMPRGGRSFPTRDAALETAVSAWRDRVDAQVSAIRAARGGTLAWGVPVEPLAEPIVIVLEQGERRSAWDLAVQMPRQAGRGVAIMSGLRPSGEVL